MATTATDSSNVARFSSSAWSRTPRRRRRDDRPGADDQEVRGQEIRPAPRMGQPLGDGDAAAEHQPDAGARKDRAGDEQWQRPGPQRGLDDDARDEPQRRRSAAGGPPRRGGEPGDQGDQEQPPDPRADGGDVVDVQPIVQEGGHQGGNKPAAVDRERGESGSGRRPARSDRDANIISASTVPSTYTANTSVVVKGLKPMRGALNAYSGIGRVPPSMTRAYTVATSQNPARTRRPPQPREPISGAMSWITVVSPLRMLQHAMPSCTEQSKIVLSFSPTCG
ncbi:hypothetical protein [Nonomuraea sp. NPDC049709]|uniref:hypothetical protein n=1 Tax=Nonomuraea sp. NPDC049709 TaxID=3154736 RepID=UPI00344477C0